MLFSSGTGISHILFCIQVLYRFGVGGLTLQWLTALPPTPFAPAWQLQPQVLLLAGVVRLVEVSILASVSPSPFSLPFEVSSLEVDSWGVVGAGGLGSGAFGWSPSASASSASASASTFMM